MKTFPFAFLFIFFISLIPHSAFSTHYMGGSVHWECLSNGNYRFIAYTYRECYWASGAATTYGNTITLSSNGPVSSIVLTKENGYPKEISPACNSNSLFPHIYCGNMPNAYGNMGAVEEFKYTSDQQYPNGVTLNGTPPAQGWKFYWGSCCRNPSTNIPGAVNKGWILLAVMYPNNNSNTNPCYDNSPVFAESPETVIPTGQHNIHFLAYDKDGDSLVYEWGEPLDVINQTINTYATGYSYTKPLPDTLQHPNNQLVKLDSQNGLVSLGSNTIGAFLTNVKVSSYRQGHKISEIWREFQVVIAPVGDTSNLPPTISTPSVQNNIFDTTVFVGDTLQFQVSATDFQFLSNGQMQTSRMKFLGQLFGEYVLPNGQTTGLYADTSGCPVKPCASMNPAPAPGEYLEGMGGVVSDFTWVPSCQHIHTFAGPQSHEHTFHFLIQAQDDYCPVAASATRLMRIKVIYHPALSKIDSIWANYDYLNQELLLHWNPVNDPHNQFLHYKVYMGATSSGPFTLVDSISNINQSSSLISNPLFPNAYFYVDVSSTTACDSLGVIASSAVQNFNFTNIKSLSSQAVFDLLPCQPNPANESTTIRFRLNRQAELTYSLIDVQGKVLEKYKIKGHSGENSLSQNLSHLKQGVYFYAVDLDGFRKIGRLVVLR